MKVLAVNLLQPQTDTAAKRMTLIKAIKIRSMDTTGTIMAKLVLDPTQFAADICSTWLAWS